MSRQVVVAGTAGGVGTTTVAALLFAGLQHEPSGAPVLQDRSSGELGLRLPEGDEVASLDGNVQLADHGSHALRCGADGNLWEVMVVVAPATARGLVDANEVLDAIEARHGKGRLRRVVVVLAAVFGWHRLGEGMHRLRERVGTRSVILLPQDLSLAAGGRVPLVRLSTHSERAQWQLVGVVRDRLRSTAPSGG